MISDFAALIDRLVITRSRSEKIALMAAYLRAASDRDRGWALAALAGSLDLRHITSSAVKQLAATRVDAELLALSREFVGDTAETVALIWPDPPAEASGEPLMLHDVVDRLREATRSTFPRILAALLDRCGSSERFAILKLALGHFRIGISERLAKTAFAEAFGVSIAEVEEYWHSSRAPHADLFAWAEGRAPPPDVSTAARFRPFMLASPLEDRLDDLSPFALEWKWDGIRVQLARAADEVRVFSRGGEEISAAFPEFDGLLPPFTAIDGELLIRDPDQPFATASFGVLQRRLGRKDPGPSLLRSAPAFVRIYDVLEVDGDDVRPCPWVTRRDALDRLAARLDPDRADVSPVLQVVDWDTLDALRQSPPSPSIEGFMLKRRDSPYLAGRVIGHWYKWKRDPYTADCVLMYAQRGSGKRASFFSDYTFGCWTEDGQLVPVGKAYSGFTDEELARLDRFVRQNTVQRFGPVVEVAKQLVFEIAFDSIGDSPRHKSGLAMRFPRISRIRWDKPATEADRVSTLQRLAGNRGREIAKPGA